MILEIHTVDGKVKYYKNIVSINKDELLITLGVKGGKTEIVYRTDRVSGLACHGLIPPAGAWSSCRYL